MQSTYGAASVTTPAAPAPAAPEHAVLLRGLDEHLSSDQSFTSNLARNLEWRFRRSGRDQVVRLSPRLIVNEVDSMLIAVRAGRGIGRPLSYQVAGDLASHSLVRLLPELEPPPLPVNLVVPSAQRLAPKLRAFLDHAARSLLSLDVLREV